VLPITNKRNAG